MKHRFRATAFAAIVAAVATQGPAEAANRGDRCAPVVQEQLAQLQLSPDQVGAISYQVKRYASRNDTDRVTGVLAWVELQGCNGKLVIDMSSRCRFKQAYTTDECTVEGLSKW